MKRAIFCLIFVLLGFTFQAQEFDIKVSPEKVNILPGVPLVVEVRITNISKSDISIAGKSLKDGIRGRITSLVKENGEELKCESTETSSMIGPFPDKPIQDKVIFKSEETFSLILKNSLYFCMNCPITTDISGKWKGRVKIEIAVAEGSLVKDIKRVELYGENVIEIEKPQGEDLAYINAVKDWLNKADPKEVKGYTAQVKPITWGELLNSFRIPVNQILLQKFPSSTYAGYAICPPDQWTSNTEPEKILKAIESGSYLSSGSVIDDTGKSKDGYLYLGGKELVEYRAKWIGIVLKSHPDIWYADHLRLRLAVDQIAIKNYQQGESELMKLSEESKGEVADKARKYLDLMRQKGWIKAVDTK